MTFGGLATTLSQVAHGAPPWEGDMRPKFEWDHDKAAANFVKHRIDFDEAGTTFDDPYLVETFDDAHSDVEPRRLAVGRSASGRLLAVVYTERGDKIRLISARPATRTERRRHDET